MEKAVLSLKDTRTAGATYYFAAGQQGALDLW